MIDYNYFQKSKAFIYPMLALPKNLHEPLETYLGIENYEFDQTTPLICLYHANAEFKKTLEELKKHNRYEFDFEVDKHYHLVIFDVSHLKKDFDYFIKGLYSRLSDKFKLAINMSSPKNRLAVLCFDPDINRRHAENSLGAPPGSLDGQEICSAPKMDTDGEIFHLKDLKPLEEFYND